MRYFFARLDEKRKLLGNFENFGRKVNRKNDFSIISGNVVAKYRALENNTRFLQQFFPISGGGDVPVFPPFQAPMPLCALMFHPKFTRICLYDM